MLIWIDKLNYFVKLMLLGAVYLIFVTAVWKLTGKRVKSSGAITFLYLFLVISASGAAVLFLTGFQLLILPQNVLGDKWSLCFSGWALSVWREHSCISVVLAGVWAAGMLYSCVCMRRQMGQLRKMLVLNHPVTEPQLRNCFEQAAEDIGIKKLPLLCSNPAVRIPFLSGPARPVVVIPEQAMDAGGWRLIFAHELMHYRRKDLIIRYGVRIVFLLYWFVPLQSIWMEEISELQETLCDIAICRRYQDSISARRYYESILSFVDGKYGMEDNYFVASRLSEGESQLERRIENMLGYRSPGKRYGINRMMVLAAALIFLFSGIAGMFSPDILKLGDDTMKTAFSLQTDYLTEEDTKLQSTLEKEETETQSTSEMDQEQVLGQEEDEQEKLSWNCLTGVWLEPGEQITTDTFLAEENEKVAMLLVASHDKYQVSLNCQQGCLVLPVSGENASVEVELEEMEYELIIENTGSSTLELQVYCISSENR